jgi:hypothetical protein
MFPPTASSSRVDILENAVTNWIWTGFIRTSFVSNVQLMYSGDTVIPDVTCELVSTINYSEQSSYVQNAYRTGDELVLQAGCSLPDLCVACGSPAWGNVEKRKFEPPGWWLLPWPFDIIRLWSGRNYLFSFPFCPNCGPEHFSLKPGRLDSQLAVFTGAPKRLLDALPPMPPEVEEEKNTSWIQRKFR